MSDVEIGKAVENVENYLQSQSDPGPQADAPATATIVSGLRCRIESPQGDSIYTDMPAHVGGGATANSPGWHLRAALASCDATLLAIRAARLGLQLDSIEVRVEASSDGRGMFLDEGISPGSSAMHLFFKIGASGVSREQIEALVHWVEQHSPVGADITRAVSVQSHIEID
ncbi:MAG: OsmC family protein [Gammaproteobacteria bacterium]|jgi:uncharacterized OsmC-like protein|nr:OsmC family protein [Gammaproteobacteria bacterium]